MVDAKVGSGEMEPAITAAGHKGATSGQGVFVKPTNATEVDFYGEMVRRHSPLLDIVPTFMGTLLPESDGKPCVVLGDMLYDFVSPNILDVKVGSILWDSNADAAKVERLRAVADSTTTGSLGFRIAGMSIYDAGERREYGKMYGREGVDASNVGHYLKAFFPTNNQYTEAVHRTMTVRLQEIVDVLAKEPVEMHSASVLFVYEGDLTKLAHNIEHQNQLNESASEYESEDDDNAPKAGILDVKVIDFAHATFGSEPYQDLVDGVSNLLTEWKKLKI